MTPNIVRVVAAPERRVRQPDGKLLPEEGIDVNIDTNLFWRRLVELVDVVIVTEQIGLSTAKAPAADKPADEAASAADAAQPNDQTTTAVKTASGTRGGRAS